LVALNICTLGIHFWWRNHTTLLYQERLKERTIEEYRAEMEEKDRAIKKLSEDNEFLSMAVHRDNKLIPAMYNAVSGFLKGFDGDPEDERKMKGAGMLKELEEIMDERKEMIASVQREHKPLPSTGMDRIDFILNHMLLKASEHGIQFDFVMAENAGNVDASIISKEKLETLIADLMENAINATAHSATKRIVLTMGFVDGCYEIDVQDSGIPFEPETLMALGVKKSTTHADSGGKGIGYLTIFKILRGCKASLTISEQMPEKSAFSKSINIRFDAASAFVVHSQREEVLNRLPDGKLCS
jgi:signal transduction histidine kinase